MGKIAMLSMGKCILKTKVVYLCFLMLLLWYTAARVCKLPFIPSPVTVFHHTGAIFYTKLLDHILYSSGRILVSVLISAILGVPLGMLMGYFAFIDRLISPVIYIVYPVPKIALLPIVMLIFGLGELSRIIIIIMIIMFQMIVATRDCIKGIAGETYYCMYSLGASRFMMIRKVLFPVSLSSLLTSVRVSLGTALSVLFFTETFGTEVGLGFFVMDAWMRVNYVEMYSGIVVLSGLGFLMFGVVDLVEMVVCGWKG